MNVEGFGDCKEYFGAYTAKDMAKALRKFSKEKFEPHARHCETHPEEFERAADDALRYIGYGCGVEG